MTKGTLRYRQSAGWSTKPAPNLDQNRLLAVEVDDNFIYLDKKISDIKAEHTTNINIAIDTANAAQAAAEVVADTLVN